MAGTSIHSLEPSISRPYNSCDNDSQWCYGRRICFNQLVVIRKEDLTGNGDTNIFGWKPKITIFHSMGKDENFMSLDQNSGLGLGGKISRLGLGLDLSLESGTFHEDVDTFDLPASAGVSEGRGKGGDIGLFEDTLEHAKGELLMCIRMPSIIPPTYNGAHSGTNI